VFARYPDARSDAAAALAELEAILHARHELGAVLIEPIQGRAGVIVPPEGFLAGLSTLCKEHGVLMIADEVLTGLGRASSLFSSVAQGARPELLCLGKALGGGLPVSACLGSAQVMASWAGWGNEALHTGTFFGNPLGCAAALATLDVIEREALCERAGEVGAKLLSRLRAALGGRVREVRGAGLMLGIELENAAQGLQLVRALLERGYIVVPAGADARVVSLTPPLTIAESLLEDFVAVLSAALAEVAA
jgi:4-aminobutyrate aminotransferase/(S)-3-amino-2-methylpropionate transaminase